MLSAASPWDWQPSRAGWCHGLRTRISEWTPQRALEPAGEAARWALFRAAEDGADWLFHPFSHSLFAHSSSLKNDLQLLVWVSVNTGEPLGIVTIDKPVWIWSMSGGQEVSPGRYEIETLARDIREDEYPLPISLDVWFESVAPAPNVDLGFGEERFWRNSPADTIKSDIIRFLRAMNLVCDHMPDCARWLGIVTTVVVPLVASHSQSFNSSSQADLPGLIFSDMKDEAQIAEALVHESAHHYFRIAEGDGPIIYPDHQDTYASPLRPEPRPLRGIFLAYHALAYICAFFAEAQALGLTTVKELENLHQKATEAELTLQRAMDHLTPAGREFFERTREVAARAR
jgi:hypothetical protein